MTNFKVGDLVKLPSVRPTYWSSWGDMDKYLGKIVVITKISGDKFNFEGDGGWYFNFTGVTLVPPCKFKVGQRYIVGDGVHIEKGNTIEITSVNKKAFAEVTMEIGYKTIVGNYLSSYFDDNSYFAHNLIFTRKPVVGDTVRVTGTRDGCKGAEGMIGVITTDKNDNGWLATNDGINIRTKTSGVWRVNADATLTIVPTTKSISKYDSMSNGELATTVCIMGGCSAGSYGNRKYDCPLKGTSCNVTDSNRPDVIKYLLEEDKPVAPKPKRYNGKVVCLTTPYTYFTPHKIYQFVDGVITGDDGTEFDPCDGDTFEDAVKDFGTKFFEIKE